MKYREIADSLPIGRTAFYKLCWRLEINPADFNEEELKKIKEAIANRKSTGVPKEYYRVVVDGVVRHAGLSKNKAHIMGAEYLKAGYNVKIIGCGGKSSHENN